MNHILVFRKEYTNQLRLEFEVPISQTHYIENIHLKYNQLNPYVQYACALNFDTTSFSYRHPDEICTSYILDPKDQVVTRIFPDYKETQDMYLEHTDQYSEELYFYPLSFELYENGAVVPAPNFSWIVNGVESASLPADQKIFKSIYIKYNFDPESDYYCIIKPGRNLLDIKTHNYRTHYNLNGYKILTKFYSEDMLFRPKSYLWFNK